MLHIFSRHTAANYVSDKAMFLNYVSDKAMFLKHQRKSELVKTIRDQLSITAKKVL
jgi:hypothetical protein